MSIGWGRAYNAVAVLILLAIYALFIVWVLGGVARHG